MAEEILSLKTLLDAEVNGTALNVAFTGAVDTPVVDSNGAFLPTYRKVLADAGEQLDAVLATNGTFTTVAAGLLATDPGDFFLVQSSSADSFADRYENVAGEGVYTGQSVATSSLVTAQRNSAGELFDVARFINGYSAGATPELDARGRQIGITFHEGSSGVPSFISCLYPFAPGEAAAMAGTTVTFRAIYDATAGFNSNWVMDVRALLVERPGGVVNTEGTVVRREQIGTLLYYDVRYTVTAIDISAGPCLQRQYTDFDYPTGTITLRSFTFTIDSLPPGRATAPVDVATATQQARALTQVKRDVGVRFADPMAEAVIASFPANGAETYQIGGKDRGWTIPAGATGAGTATSITYVAKFGSVESPAARYVGQRMRVGVWLRTTAGYPRATITLGMQILLNGAPAGGPYRDVVFEPYTVTDLSPTQQYFEGELELEGDEWTLRPFIRNDNATPVAADVSCYIEDILFEFVGEPRLALTAATQAADYREERLLERAAGTATRIIVPMVPDADGLLPSFADTIAALTDRSEKRQYLLDAKRGRVRGSDVNLSVPDWVSIRTPVADVVFDQALMPDSTPLDQQQNYQAFVLRGNNDLIGATIYCRNGRYAVHSDEGNTRADQVQNFVDCTLVHYGNVPGGWNSTSGAGIGMSSGHRINSLRSTFISPTAAYRFHTQTHFANPSENHIENCRLIATQEDWFSLMIEPAGSFQTDVCEVKGSLLQGDILYSSGLTQLTDRAEMPGNNTEVRLFGYGNRGTHAFRINEYGRVFRIRSATTGTDSSVEITGTAVPIILGRKTYATTGAPGIAGDAYGWLDVSDRMSNAGGQFLSIAARLGNCTFNTKTLIVTIDGGAPVTHTFDQDYTSWTNAAVYASINATLAGAATAEMYNVGGRYRPSFTDEEMALQNTTDTAIRMGMLCALDLDERYIRPMTSTDDKSLFVGVAWEDIVPGQCGRIKTSGRLSLVNEVPDILRSDSAALAFRDSFSIDPAAPGWAYKGGDQGLLPAYRANAVRVGLR